MILLLINFINCNDLCKINIKIDYNHPELFNFMVQKGDIICINSSFIFLTVMFNKLPNCSLRAFKNTRSFKIKEEYENLEINQQFAGVDFGWETGHLEIQCYETSFISFNLFAFPKYCGSYRYISHSPSDVVTLANLLHRKHFSNNNKTFCIFPSGLLEYLLHIPSYIPQNTIHLDICTEIDNCLTLSDNKWKILTNKYFLKINSNSNIFSYMFAIQLEQINFYSLYETKIVLNSDSLDRKSVV